jgi:hypothetical protein
VSNAEPGTVVTWLDGRVQTVPADDPRLAEIEAARTQARHLANLRRLDLHGRRNYFAGVARSEGEAAAGLLKTAFGADWERRRRRSAG